MCKLLNGYSSTGTNRYLTIVPMWQPLNIWTTAFTQSSQNVKNIPKKGILLTLEMNCLSFKVSANELQTYINLPGLVIQWKLPFFTQLYETFI